MKITRSGSCDPSVKFVRRWPALDSKSVTLTGNYVEQTDNEWKRVIVPMYDFKDCTWPKLDNAMDLVFNNCPSGEHPKYEVRDIRFTDTPLTFPGCEGGCDTDSHDVFVNHCNGNGPAKTLPDVDAAAPVKKVTIFKELNNLCGGADEHYHWKLPIPAGADKVYCKTWGGEGNVALYTRWDANIDIWVARYNKCVSNEDGSNNMEECSGDDLKPYGKTLHVGVLAYNEAFCNVSVTCSYEIDEDSADSTPDYSVKTFPSESCAQVCPAPTQRRGLRASSTSTVYQ